MLGLERRRTIDKVSGKAQLVTAGIVVAFGAALKADLQRWQSVSVVGPTLGWMQANAWIVVVFGPILVALLQAVRRTYGNPWAWESLQQVLDHFRTELFGVLEDDPSDHHRVTLFKYHRYHFRLDQLRLRYWRGWLVAVARSDHLTKERIRRFRAPDDAEKCEGVVGRAWRCKSWVIVPAGSEPLPTLDRRSSDDQVRVYAKAAFVDEAWIRLQIERGRPFAASFAALTVRLKGKPWGVLVIDSRGDAAIDKSRLSRFNVYGTLLTPLLERV